MNTVYQNYGLGFSGEEMAQADITSGGHSHCRAIADQLQA